MPRSKQEIVMFAMLALSSFSVPSALAATVWQDTDSVLQIRQGDVVRFMSDVKLECGTFHGINGKIFSKELVSEKVLASAIAQTSAKCALNSAIILGGGQALSVVKASITPGIFLLAAERFDLILTDSQGNTYDLALADRSMEPEVGQATIGQLRKQFEYAILIEKGE